MAENPQTSLPRQAQSWSATMGAYRFLHNDRVTPGEMQRGAIEATRQACIGPVTLLLHDLTEFDPVHALSPTKLLQHTTLAVNGDSGGGGVADVLGVMHQRCFDDPAKPVGETRKQRRERWTRSQVWPQAVAAMAAMGQPLNGSRYIHVADREADDFQMFAACDAAGQGFVIRSQHDRLLADGARLRETVSKQPACGQIEVTVARRRAVGAEAPPRARRQAQAQRLAKCEVRFTAVMLAPPANDPRYQAPRLTYAVSVREIDPPADVEEPIDWLLLTSEPVTCLADAVKVIGWYRRRWTIEEYHKAQKTGCRLEQSQLEDRQAFIRLAAIAGLVAVRLLQLRQWADDAAPGAAPGAADKPAAEYIDDPLWLRIVSHLAKHDDPRTLTVKQFHRTLARLGGWLGRKSDGRPGWQSLWDGYHKVAAYVEGARLARQLEEDAGGCV
jgi:hypothetical protein